MEMNNKTDDDTTDASVMFENGPTIAWERYNIQSLFCNLV